MNPINLRIVFVDGSEAEVTAIAADLIKFESHFNISIARLGDDVRLTYLFYLAWAVQSRTKITDRDFEEWSETVQIVTDASSKKA